MAPDCAGSKSQMRPMLSRRRKGTESRIGSSHDGEAPLSLTKFYPIYVEIQRK